MIPLAMAHGLSYVQLFNKEVTNEKNSSCTGSNLAGCLRFYAQDRFFAGIAFKCNGKWLPGCNKIGCNRQQRCRNKCFCTCSKNGSEQIGVRASGVAEPERFFRL